MTDASAFEAFVRRFQDMVYATAMRLLGNPAEAEDVAQTVFLKAFQRFEQIGPSEAAAGWLRTTTRHECLNHLSRYRARWRSLDDSVQTGSATLLGSRPDTDFEHAETQARLEQAIRSLPDHQRVPLVLFHFDELSYHEIAQILGVSLGKVKTDIHRGREALKRVLIPHESV